MSFINKISINGISSSIGTKINKLNLNGVVYDLGLDTMDATGSAEWVRQNDVVYIKGERVVGECLVRYWVNNNGSLVISSSEPEVAVAPTDYNYCQTNISPSNKVNYASMLVPKGVYNGKSYVGVPSNNINLISSNIKHDVVVFGNVKGTFTSDGTAQSGHIMQGYIGYSKGQRYVGTILDRSTVGRNSAIGINAQYNNVALIVGHTPQNSLAVDGKEYFCIGVPEGYYNGKSYVGILHSTAKSIVNSL